MVIELNENDFDEKTKQTCLVDFFATWCPPCQMLTPIVEKVSEDYKDKLKFYKINIDQNSAIAEKFEIMYVPTLILFKNGEAINKESSFMEEKKLIEFIKKAM